LPAKSTQGYGFGTFKGVFTPSILTILGVVMYLRFGYVLGHVGSFWTVVIVTLATSVTFLTALSLSALATNMKVGGGGAYFIISRSLGLETGAAIGVPLFFAQAFGIAFYIAGFSESMVDFFNESAPKCTQFIANNLGPPVIVIGIIALLTLALLAYFSADLALKTQFIILVLIISSLVVFFTGSMDGIQETVEHAKGTGTSHIFNFPSNFWPVFAIFFPAVTGIEAGLSMSGDLKDPAKSLPLGTLSAIGVSYVIYLAIPLYLAYLIPYASEAGSKMLISDSLIMCKVAGEKLGMIVLLAIWGASLSSAMGALLGAPRTMQALAKDAVIPRFIGKGFGKGNDPRIATVITFALALTGIILGDLNLIAPILAMFFLTSYCLLNIAAGIEGLLGSPSWRPAFRIHWTVSFIGAMLCAGIMIQINFAATLLALLITGFIYYFVKRRRLLAHWGDTRYGILMLAARNAIYQMAGKQVDEKNWQPNILLLSGAPTTRWRLIELANAITAGQGLLTVAAIVKEKQASTERIDSIEDSMQTYLKKRNITALVKVIRNNSPMDGAMELVNTYGFGPLVPNTILVGISEKKENFIKFATLIKLIHDSKRNAIIVREPQNVDQDQIKCDRIDIWWGGKTNNGALMIALAYLLHKHPGWTQSRTILKTIISKEEERDNVKRRLDDFINKSRLEITGEVILNTKKSIFETVCDSSKDANLVFLGIRPPGENETIEDYSKYYQELLDNTKDLPLLVKTLASEDIEFRRIFQT